MKTKNYMLVAGLLYPLFCTADDAQYVGSEEWQKRRLLAPSPVELAEEAKGRIFIYDGLENTAVDVALDEEFHRMEHMMFIRIKEALPDGNVVAYEDDGC